MSANRDISYDLFLKDTTITNVGAVWEISKPKSVVIVGTVISVNKCWYHMTCPKCSHKATLEVEELFAPDCFDDFQQFDVYYCSNYQCSENTVEPVPKFKINLEVSDESDDVELILFHDQAVQLFNKSPKLLIEENTMSDDIMKLPEDIELIVGKVFAFKIEVTEHNLVHYDEVYGITHISDDANLIVEIKNNFVSLQDQKNVNGKRCVNEVKDIHVIEHSVSTKRKTIG
ncbi:uncharacterized protein LOC110901287 [Helianthus annuus]|uniref:uncharacterized protein LOC110901287 n=1 Tax=Helianthus annuus TaxID=4232 RepID=UPI000B8F508C|nr:uncharacterized protein LOC110901287 [Helianthus annuus]